MQPAPRRLILCADDYGISPGVSRGIRELIAQGRLNATSVMTLAPAFSREEAAALRAAIGDGAHCAIGLHVTLTAPFAPLTLHFSPLGGGQFLPLGAMLLRALMRRLDREAIAAEITAQIEAFREAFGRAPDFVDGHQHVQTFPVVREAFLDAVKSHAPGAYVRQSGRTHRKPDLANPKALLLDMLSAAFRKHARAAGVAFNPSFDGAYEFSRHGDFASLFPTFLKGLPDGALVMCHPGYVDDSLRTLDPLTDQRERELAYFASDAFSRTLRAENMSLA